MDFFSSNTSDWIYIAGVVIAFFIFLVWNKKQQASRKGPKRKRFKDRIEEKRKERNKD